MLNQPYGQAPDADEITAQARRDMIETGRPPVISPQTRARPGTPPGFGATSR